MSTDEVMQHQEQGEAQEVVADMQQVAEEVTNTEQKMVPLSALQEERKKRKDLKEYYEQQQQQQPQEEDYSRYESVTKEDLQKSQTEIARVIEEKSWIRSNPEKYEVISKKLPEFIKQRPNLASAINSAENRYEEAYQLMKALSPREKQQLEDAAEGKSVIRNPSSAPKTANLNDSVDVMQMSDEEFQNWRKSKVRAGRK